MRQAAPDDFALPHHDSTQIQPRNDGSLMAAKKVDFSEILIRQGTISADQLAEAKRVAKTSGKKVSDQLVVLGYATGDEVMRAIAKEHGLDFIDLNEVVIPPSDRRTGARVGGPRKRHSADGRRRRRAEGDRQRSAGPRYVRETAVHSQPQGRHRPGPARKHPRGDQPPLRPNGRSKRRLDAPGVHRHGDRLYRDRAGIRGLRTRSSTKPAPRSSGWCS